MVNTYRADRIKYLETQFTKDLVLMKHAYEQDIECINQILKDDTPLYREVTYKISKDRKSIHWSVRRNCDDYRYDDITHGFEKRYKFTSQSLGKTKTHIIPAHYYITVVKKFDRNFRQGEEDVNYTMDKLADEYFKLHKAEIFEVKKRKK